MIKLLQYAITVKPKPTINLNIHFMESLLFVHYKCLSNTLSEVIGEK